MSERTYRYIPAVGCAAEESFLLQVDGRDFPLDRPLKERCNSCPNEDHKALLVAIFGNKGLEEVQCLADCDQNIGG